MDRIITMAVNWLEGNKKSAEPTSTIHERQWSYAEEWPYVKEW